MLCRHLSQNEVHQRSFDRDCTRQAATCGARSDRTRHVKFCDGSVHRPRPSTSRCGPYFESHVAARAARLRFETLGARDVGRSSAFGGGEGQVQSIFFPRMGRTRNGLYGAEERVVCAAVGPFFQINQGTVVAIPHDLKTCVLQKFSSHSMAGIIAAMSTTPSQTYSLPKAQRGYVSFF